MYSEIDFDEIAEMMELNNDEELKHQWKHFYDTLHVFGLKVFKGCDKKEVKQPKTGHWIWCFGSHKCSNCEGYTCFSDKQLLRYCPNCGSKMFNSRGSGVKE